VYSSADSVRCIGEGIRSTGGLSGAVFDGFFEKVLSMEQSSRLGRTFRFNAFLKKNQTLSAKDIKVTPTPEKQTEKLPNLNRLQFQDYFFQNQNFFRVTIHWKIIL
jgi:hypothetical protein